MTDEHNNASSGTDASTGRVSSPDAGLKAVILADFAQHGPDAVEALRLERPHDYLKLVASFSPNEPDAATPTVEDLTDDEFIRVLNALRPRTPAEGSGPNKGGGA